jgi:thiosulfate/3-mercaptopyruvate sulfurtransferase
MEFLIEPRELQALAQKDELLVLDARRPADYAKGHIPGAVNFSTYDDFVLDTRPEGLAAFARNLVARYAGVGVSKFRPIVVYEDDTGMRAAREAWMLEYLGHPRVKILHGGLAAWRAAGCNLSLERTGDWTVALRVHARSELVIGADEIAARLGAPGWTLLDVRDANENAGRDKTACCPRRGRIPGSVWIEWTNFLSGGRFKEPEAIRSLLAERGVDPESEIVPYCHRGARSANTYYALRRAGLKKVRNYIGSWHEWSSRADLPLEKP